MTNRKIRVSLRAFDVELIDQSAKAIVQRSPHVNKKSREQFEMRTHKRLIDIFDPSAEVMDSLMKLELSAGVDVEIKQ